MSERDTPAWRARDMVMCVEAARDAAAEALRVVHLCERDAAEVSARPTPEQMAVLDAAARELVALVRAIKVRLPLLIERGALH